MSIHHLLKVKRSKKESITKQNNHRISKEYSYRTDKKKTSCDLNVQNNKNFINGNQQIYHTGCLSPVKIIKQKKDSFSSIPHSEDCCYFDLNKTKYVQNDSFRCHECRSVLSVQGKYQQTVTTLSESSFLSSLRSSSGSSSSLGSQKVSFLPLQHPNRMSPVTAFTDIMNQTFHSSSSSCSACFFSREQSTDTLNTTILSDTRVLRSDNNSGKHSKNIQKTRKKNRKRRNKSDTDCKHLHRDTKSYSKKHTITDNHSSATLTNVKMICRISSSLKNRQYTSHGVSCTVAPIFWKLLSVILLTLSGLYSAEVRLENLPLQIRNTHQSSLSSLNKIGDDVTNANGNIRLIREQNEQYHSLDKQKATVKRSNRLTSAYSESFTSIFSSLPFYHLSLLNTLSTGHDSATLDKNAWMLVDTSMNNNRVDLNKPQSRFRRSVTQPQTFSFPLSSSSSSKSSSSSSILSSHTWNAFSSTLSLPQKNPLTHGQRSSRIILSSLGGIFRRPLYLLRRRVDNTGRAHNWEIQSYKKNRQTSRDGSTNRLSNFVRNRFNKMADSWRNKLRFVDERKTNNSETLLNINSEMPVKSSSNTSSIVKNEQVPLTLSQSTINSFDKGNEHKSEQSQQQQEIEKQKKQQEQDSPLSVNNLVKMNLSQRGDNDEADHHDRRYESVSLTSSLLATPMFNTLNESLSLEGEEEDEEKEQQPLSKQDGIKHNRENNNEYKPLNGELSNNHLDESIHSQTAINAVKGDSNLSSTVQTQKISSVDKNYFFHNNSSLNENSRSNGTHNIFDEKVARESDMLSKPVTLNVIDVDPVRTKIAHNILIVRKSTAKPSTILTPPPPIIISTVMNSLSHQHSAQVTPTNKHKSKEIVMKNNKKQQSTANDDQNLEFVPIRSNHGSWSSIGHSAGTGFESFTKWKERNKNKFQPGIVSASSSLSPILFSSSYISELTPSISETNSGTTSTTVIMTKKAPVKIAIPVSITTAISGAADTTTATTTTTTQRPPTTTPHTSYSNIFSFSTKTTTPFSKEILFNDRDHDANFHWFTPSSTLTLSSSSHLYNTDAFTLSPLSVSSVNWALTGEKIKNTVSSTTATPTTTFQANQENTEVNFEWSSTVASKETAEKQITSSSLSSLLEPFNEFLSAASLPIDSTLQTSNTTLHQIFSSQNSQYKPNEDFLNVVSSTTIKNEFDLASTANPQSNYDNANISSDISLMLSNVQTTFAPPATIKPDFSNPELNVLNSKIIPNSTNEFENAIAEILINKQTITSSHQTFPMINNSSDDSQTTLTFEEELEQSKRHPTLTFSRPQKPHSQMQSVLVTAAIDSQDNEFDTPIFKERRPKPTMKPLIDDGVVIFKNNHGKYRKRKPPMTTSTRRPHRPRTTPFTTIRLPIVTAKPPYLVEFATHASTPTTTVITTRKPPAISVTNISANRLKPPENVHSSAITVQDPPFVPGISMKLPLNTTIVHKNLLVPMKIGRPRPQYPTRPSTEFPLYPLVASITGWQDGTMTTDWIPPRITTTAPDKIVQFLPSINQAVAAEAEATATTSVHETSTKRFSMIPTTPPPVRWFTEEPRPLSTTIFSSKIGNKSTTKTITTTTKTIKKSTSTTTTKPPINSTRQPYRTSTIAVSTPNRRQSTITKRPLTPYVNAIYMPPMPVLPQVPNLDSIKPLPMWARWLGHIMNRVMPDPTQPVSFMSLVRSVFYSVMVILIPPMALLTVFTA